MTIAKRLQFLLSTLLGALILVGALGAVQLHLQSRSINFINTKIVPSLAVINGIETNFAILRGTVLRHILSNDNQDKSELEEEIEHVRNEIDEDLAEYNANLIVNHRDRELFLDGQAKIEKYYALIDQALPLSKSFQSVLAVEKMFIARPMIDAVTSALDIHSNYNLRLTDNEGAMAEARAKRDSWIILCVLAIAAAIGLFQGLTAHRQITESLHAMKTAMVDIAYHLNFTQRVTIQNQDEVADAATAFNALLDKVQDSLRTMRSWAERINASSSMLAFAVQQVSTHSGEQSKAASSMAATVEELATNVNRVAGRTEEVNTLTIDAGATAQKGISAIEQVLDDIRGTQAVVVPVAESVIRLDEDNAKVSTVVLVIRSVAEQAGQLAQKAAGIINQGHGEFPAVADEIRRMAERTVQSTEDIAVTMASIQTDADHAIDGTLTAIAQVEKSVARAMAAENAVREIASGSKQTVFMVDEIARAIRQQDTACQTIAKQVEHVAYISEENSAIAQNAALHSRELHDIAKAMRSETELYQV